MRGMEEDKLPEAGRESVVEIGGFKLRCYHLDDGRRVFHADDVHAFLGIPSPPVTETKSEG